MSGVASEPGRRPAVAAPVEVTDSLGRKLKLTKLDAMTELDLIEAAGGKNADNRRWMTMATLAACVETIDGAPLPGLVDRNAIRMRVKLVGSEGIAAVVEALAPDAAEVVAGDDADGTATAKN